MEKPYHSKHIFANRENGLPWEGSRPGGENMLNLEAIANWRVDATVKGFPGTAEPGPLSGIGARGWNVLRGDLPLPVAVLKVQALDHNRRWMKRFLAAARVGIAPHGKTTMAPQIFAWQIEDGAWGMTCATVAQLQVYRAAGVTRVLMANQIAGRANIAFVARELSRDPAFELYALVDSPEGARYLAEGLRASGATRPLNVLIEMGDPAGRTGAVSLAAALETAREIAAHPGELALAGVEGYEAVGVPLAPPEALARAERILAGIVETARTLDNAGLFRTGEVILTAGGSEFFDLVAKRLANIGLSVPARAIIRSGCYLTHDDGLYRGSFEGIRARGLFDGLAQEGLIPALEIWTAVQSRPEPARAFLCAGKRDVSHDAGMPVAKRWYREGLHAAPVDMPAGHAISRLNDQHAYLDTLADSPLKIGDLVGLGISHPCTTFDKWRLIYLVDETYDVTGAVKTFF